MGVDDSMMSIAEALDSIPDGLDVGDVPGFVYKHVRDNAVKKSPHISPREEVAAAMLARSIVSAILKGCQ